MSDEANYFRVSRGYMAGVFYACAILLGVLCTLVGSLLPWAETDISLNSFAGPTVAGLEAGEVYSIALATVATIGVLGFVLDLRARWFLGLSLVAGALVAASAADWWIQWHQIDPSDYNADFLNIKEGLYLTLAGGTVTAAFSLMAIIGTGLGRIKGEPARGGYEETSR